MLFRSIKTLDNETGLPYYLDTANKAMQITAHRFVASGREEQRKLRNLFYHLRGRQRAIWVATSSTDVTPVGDIVGKTLDIAYINYTGALQKQTGRQDVRIECTGGRIFYRRIVSSAVFYFIIDLVFPNFHHISLMDFPRGFHWLSADGNSTL